MIESDTGKKNAQRVTINITIVIFVKIPGYGTLIYTFELEEPSSLS